MYNPRSMKATEFIDHQEILDTLAYADAHKDDLQLVDAILEKAKDCKGLSHREASVLLACEDETRLQRMYDLAKEIKLRFYGNRIVLFAPLYLSNYCVNGCVYCPYHAKNKHIGRKKLTQEEVAREVIALQDMGHKRLAIEAGEDPKNNPIEYILECIKTIYSIHHKNGDIRRVNVNIAATTVEEYRMLKEAGIGTYILFQETYHKETVVLLGRKFEKSREHVYLDYEPSAEIDLPGGATYSEIKQWIQAEYDLNVSSLYVAQVKQKHGIVERECYNKPKSENAKQPKCPPEKEAAIEAALKHFKMI